MNDKGQRLSVEARDLIQAFLTLDASHRISAEVALLHPWITKNKLNNSS